jgi:DNA-binding MarR family transcriptional regulator
MPQARTTASSPLLASSVLHLLHRAGQRADGLFARHAGTTLTPRQFVILQAVAEANGLSQTGIMAATGIDRSSTADLVRRLVTHGWLKRRRTKRDARLYAVRLTPEGRRVLALSMPAARATEVALLSSLSSAQRPAFLEALAVIATEQNQEPPDKGKA